MANRHLQGARVWAKAALLGRIKYLILHVTSVCNARCRMCFNWDAMQERRDAAGPGLDDLERLAKSLKALPQLTLSGGEPLLRNDIPEILGAFYRHAGTRFFTVPTNALRPGGVDDLIGRFLTECPEAFLNLCLPFHGAGPAHDDIMGVPGAFDRLTETYGVIAAAREGRPNLSCSLNFVMSKFNHERYETIIDAALSGFPLASIGVAYARGLTHERDATDVPLEDYHAAQQYLTQRRGAVPRNPYSLMFSAIGDQTQAIVTGVVEGSIPNLRCKAGRRFIVVYDDGSVYPCEMIDIALPPGGEGAPVSWRLGDLNEFGYDLGRLLDSPHARQALAWLDEQGCACTWECAIFSRLIHSPAEAAKVGLRGTRTFLSGGNRE